MRSSQKGINFVQGNAHVFVSRRDLQEHPCQHRSENEFKGKRIEHTKGTRKCCSVLGQGSPEGALAESPLMSHPNLSTSLMSMSRFSVSTCLSS